LLALALVTSLRDVTLFQIYGEKRMEENNILKALVNSLEDRKAEDTEVIDIREISPVADYFVIATGLSPNHLKAMRDTVEEVMFKAGIHEKSIEGTQKSAWILMDYGDIVVHIMSKEERQFYGLERIWNDGKIINPLEL
jgi:ribosome-associated protein